MKKLKPDMSNYNEVRQEMLDLVRTPHRKNLEKRNRDLEPVMRGITRMFNDFGFQYDPNTVTGSTVLEFMNTLATRIQAGDKDVEAKFAEMDREDYLLSLYDAPDMLSALMQFDTSEDSLLEYYLGEEGEGIYDDEWVPIANSINMGQENYDMHIYSQDEINSKVEEMSAQAVDYVEQTLTQLKDEVIADPFVQMMDDVDKAVTSINPVT